MFTFESIKAKIFGENAGKVLGLTHNQFLKLSEASKERLLELVLDFSDQSTLNEMWENANKSSISAQGEQK